MTAPRHKRTEEGLVRKTRPAPRVPRKVKVERTERQLRDALGDARRYRFPGRNPLDREVAQLKQRRAHQKERD